MAQLQKVFSSLESLAKGKGAKFILPGEQHSALSDRKPTNADDTLKVDENLKLKKFASLAVNQAVEVAQSEHQTVEHDQ